MIGFSSSSAREREEREIREWQEGKMSAVGGSHGPVAKSGIQFKMPYLCAYMSD
jgi:hypothetical protein